MILAPTTFVVGLSSTAAATIEEIPGRVTVNGPNGRRYIVDCPTQVLTGPDARIPSADLDAAPDKSAGTVKEKQPPADMTNVLPEWKQTCESGDPAAVRDFLNQHPGLPEAIFTDGSLKRNALSVAISKFPYGDHRIEIIRLLVKKSADPAFIDRRGDQEMGMEASYNAVSYPENLGLDELEYLLRKGADPDLGVCVPAEPPLLRLAKMTFENKAEFGDAKITRDGLLDRIKILVKHGADPSKKAGIATSVNAGNKQIPAESAKQLATDSGSADLQSALGID